MYIALGVISPSAAWVLPRRYVEGLRRDFPQHTFLEAWDRETLRRVLADSDAAFAALLDKDLVPSLTRLRWVQAPAAGVAHMLSSELAASPIVLTSARGVRARAIAEHVMLMALALARQLPVDARASGEARLGAGRDRNLRHRPHPPRQATRHRRPRVDRHRSGAPGGRLRHARDRDPQARWRNPSARRRRGASAGAARGVAVVQRRRRALGRADRRYASAREPRSARTRQARRVCSSTSAAAGSSTTTPSSRRFATAGSAAPRWMCSPGSRCRQTARIGICRTSSSRRTYRARWRTTGRRSSPCSLKTCAVSRRARRC